LDPNIIRSKWTPEEDERLVRAVETHGRTWSKINEEEFPKRSTTDLKNRYILEKSAVSANWLSTTGMRLFYDGGIREDH
jgi:hypothetical protein